MLALATLLCRAGRQRGRIASCFFNSHRSCFFALPRATAVRSACSTRTSTNHVCTLHVLNMFRKRFMLRGFDWLLKPAARRESRGAAARPAGSAEQSRTRKCKKGGDDSLTSNSVVDAARPPSPNKTRCSPARPCTHHFAWHQGHSCTQLSPP